MIDLNLIKSVITFNINDLNIAIRRYCQIAFKNT